MARLWLAFFVGAVLPFALWAESLSEDDIYMSEEIYLTEAEADGRGLDDGIRRASVPKGSPKIISSTFRTSSSYFGNLASSVASPRVQFDEDLYTSENLFCASTLNQPPKSPVCVPCNYSWPTVGSIFSL